MSAFSGPKIATANLIFCVDSVNIKSYNYNLIPYTTNLLTLLDNVNGGTSAIAGSGFSAPDNTTEAIQVTSTGGDPYVWWNGISFNAGTTYNFSIWMKGQGSALNKNFTMAMYDGTAWVSGSWGTNYTIQSSWQRISQTFTPSNSGTGQVRVDCPETGGVFGDIVYLYGIQLSVGSDLLPYLKNAGVSTATTLYDLSSSKFTSTVTTPAVTTSGIANGSVITTATNSLLDTDTHTMSFLINFNSSAAYPNGTSGSWDKIFGYNSGGTTDRSPGIWRWPNNRWIHWRYDPGNTGVNIDAVSVADTITTEFSLNTWYHVTGVKSGGTLTIYLNGKYLGAASGIANPKTTGSAAFRFFDSAYTAPVKINCMNIYNRSLSADEVFQNYINIKNRFGI